MNPAARIDRYKSELGGGNFIDTGALRVHYARKGEGDPLVLLHGWPEFWLTWRKNIGPLSHHADVIAPDIRGFGESAPTDGTAGAPLTPDIMADDLCRLLDALEIERAVLVSHDVGSAAAQALARTHPDRVRGLFFFNVAYPGIGKRWAAAHSIPNIWYQSFNQTALAPKLVGHSRETMRLYFGHILAAWCKDPQAFDEDLELWVENFMRPGNLEGGFAWYKGADAARRKTIRDGAPKLDKIKAPTRVLWGRHDGVLLAEWTDGLEDYFADLDVSVCEDAGHFVHYEQPDAANAEIIRFLSQLDGNA